MTDAHVLRELHARLADAGVLARCDSIYARRLAVLVPLWLATFAALYLAPVVRPALVVLSGLLSVQLGLLGHDAGHQQIHRDRRINEFWGYLVMDVMCGQSFRHWCQRHDQHHRETHVEGCDPDIKYDVVLSVYERAAHQKQGVGRVLRPYQAYYFWPIGVFYVWALRWDSLRHTREPWLLVLHYVLWLAPALWVGPVAIAIYVAVSSIISVLLVALFAPNHIGMHTAESGERTLAQRIAASRNIRNPRWLDGLFGGLNAHIEHHLFPRICSPRLRAAREITREFCRERGIAYHEQTFFAAHRNVLAFLMAMARVR